MASTLAVVTVTKTPYINEDPHQTVTYEVVRSPLAGEGLAPNIFTLEISDVIGEARTNAVYSVDPTVSQLLQLAEAVKPTLSKVDTDSVGSLPSSHPIATTDFSTEFPSPSTALNSVLTTLSGSSFFTSSSSAGSPLPVSGSSSASPIAATSGPHQNNGLSDGAAAGIAVGCFVAGLLAAALVALLLMGRRRKRHRHYDPAAAYDVKEHSPMTSDTPIQKDPSVVVAAFPPASAAAIVEDALPRPADEETLRLAFMSLRTQVNNNVLSFYRTNPSQEQPSPEPLPAPLARSDASPESVQALLRDHRTRTAAMRYIVAWIATTRMDSSGTGSPTTFLPDQVASFRDLVSSTGLDEAHGAFLSKWRTITAYLLSPNFERSASENNGAGRTKTDDAVAAVDSVLRTYAKGDTSERLRNLEEVMRRAGRLAFMLFAQPAEFRLEWGRAEQELVVFPGLVQTSDENGRVLRVEGIVLERDVVRV